MMKRITQLNITGKHPKWQETDQLVGYGLVNMCDYSEMNYHNNFFFCWFGLLYRKEKVNAVICWRRLRNWPSTATKVL